MERIIEFIMGILGISLGFSTFFVNNVRVAIDAYSTSYPLYYLSPFFFAVGIAFLGFALYVEYRWKKHIAKLDAYITKYNIQINSKEETHHE